MTQLLDDKIYKRSKNSIMRRVYFIWVLKKALSPTLVRLYILTLFIWQTSYKVSFANVFNNTPGFGDFAKNFTYFKYAFMHTEFIVQAALIAFLVVVALMCKDFGKYLFKHQHGFLMFKEG